MSFRNETDRLLASDDDAAVEKALRVLADAVDTLWAARANAERIQNLAEQGFAQGLKGE